MICRAASCGLAALMLLAGTATALTASARDCARPLTALPATDVYFSPWDDAQQQLLKVLDEACAQIRVQAFLLTSRDIAAALTAAHRRGVDVQLLADARQHDGNPASLLAKLRQVGIPVWLENRYRNAHNKVIVVDAHSPAPVVVTGSYNFTWGAQHLNAENLLIIRGQPAIAERYAANWERHRADAAPLAVH